MYDECSTMLWIYLPNGLSTLLAELEVVMKPQMSSYEILFLGYISPNSFH